MRTGLEIALVDGATLAAEGVGDIEGEVVASLLSRHAEQLAILCRREVLVEVGVQRRAAGEMGDIAAAVQAELLDDVGVGVFDDVEVAVVAVARHVVAILAVPAGVLDADILGGNHLAVEEQVFRAVLLIVRLDEAQYAADEGGILVVVADGEPEAFGGLDDAVDADGQILALDVDVAGVEEGQHTLVKEFLQVGIVGHLHLVHKVHDALEILHIRTALAGGLLDATVDVDGQHTLRARRYAAGAEGITEAVVLNLVAQAAAGGQAVGIVAHVGKEGVTLGVHLGGEVGILLVHDVAILREQGHRLDGESEDGLGALLVEPAHEALLQPADGGP